MAKPCGFAIEFNPLGTPPLSLYSSTRDGAPHAGVDDGVAGAARCAWTGGRSGGVSHRASAGWAAVLRPVPSPRRTTTVLWVRWCRLLCARAPCCAGSVPGRRTPAHICAQSLSMLWVCGMEQGWAILQVEHPPDEASWRNPNVYYDSCGPPSPSRTRAGSCYGSDRLHCLSPNETHIPVGLHEQHNNAVGFMPSGFVWVNSLKKRRNPLRALKKKATEDKENIILPFFTTGRFGPLTLTPVQKVHS